MFKTERENIKIQGRKGTWYVIKDYDYYGKIFHLLEHEVYGEDTAHLWVDEEHKIVLDEVFNGLDDLIEWIEEQEGEEVKIKSNMPVWATME